MEVSTGVILLTIFLLSSAMVSAAETALFSLSANDKKKLENNKSLSSKIILRLIDKPEYVIATLLISNIFLNVAFIIIALKLTSPLLSGLNPVALPIFIQIAAITVILLFAGELLPKAYAKKYSFNIALITAIPVIISGKIFYPFSVIISGTTNIINKRLKHKQKNMKVEELSQAINFATDHQDEERDMLEGIVNFSNKQVKEIMKPRVNIVGLNKKWDMNEVISVIVDSGYSRLPVYENDFDNIKGILYVKDLLPNLKDRNKINFNWQKLIRDFYFVPESKKISELLQDFQQKKIHMAVVIDEYGGTSGLITLEDILEEIVGEITDESDSEEALYKKHNDNSYEFAAHISLNDFCKIMKCDSGIFDDIKGEAESLAGIILEIKGEMPAKGETIKYDNFLFTIKAVDNRRIKLVNVKYEASE